jgi:predicted nucleotide-binding protein
VTYDGRTADSKRSSIKVFETNDPIPRDQQGSSLNAMQSGEDVTNEWIVGPAGHGATAAPSPGDPEVAPLKDPARVMVVHGRNLSLRTAMFTFLRALGLRPIEWEDAIAATGMASPHNLAAVRAAMDVAQAVVVLLTAEDRAGLIPELADSVDSTESELAGQPRQNVILEAGMAMGLEPSRTILVQVAASEAPAISMVSMWSDLQTMPSEEAPCDAA